MIVIYMVYGILLMTVHDTRYIIFSVIFILFNIIIIIIIIHIMISHNDRMKEIKKLKQIGEGTYGTVYKAIDTMSNECVAVKVIKFDNMDEGIPSTAMREISILKSLDHHRIVKLKEIMYSNEGFKDSLNLIFEYVDTDIQQILNNDQRVIDDATIKRYFRQIVEGIVYMHDNGYIHRDIKPSNILVDNNDDVKIADLGLSRMYLYPLREYTHDVR